MCLSDSVIACCLNKASWHNAFKNSTPTDQWNSSTWPSNSVIACCLNKARWHSAFINSTPTYQWNSFMWPSNSVIACCLNKTIWHNTFKNSTPTDQWNSSTWPSNSVIACCLDKARWQNALQNSTPTDQWNSSTCDLQTQWSHVAWGNRLFRVCLQHCYVLSYNQKVLKFVTTQQANSFKTNKSPVQEIQSRRLCSRFVTLDWFPETIEGLRSGARNTSCIYFLTLTLQQSATTYDKCRFCWMVLA